MIRIFEGVPGSGKTYAMVHYLRKYAEWDDFYQEWVLKDGVLIFSNIDSLRLPHIDLDRALNELGGLERVFSTEHITALLDKGFKKVIFAIDEAQRYFNRRFFNEDVFYFFQYHRHYGVDILLATQDVSSIAKELRVLAEFVIRAEQRSLTLNAFKYRFYTSDNKTHLFNKTLKKDKRVFAMYKSFMVEEVDKPPNVLLRRLVIPLAGFLLFIALAYFYVVVFMFPSDRSDRVLSSPVSPYKPSSPHPVPPSPSPSSSFPFTYSLSGYVRVGEVSYYFTRDRRVYVDYHRFCFVKPDYTLACVREPRLYRVLPPHLPAVAELQESPTTDVGGRGLVDLYTNKSHAPATQEVPYAPR